MMFKKHKDNISFVTRHRRDRFGFCEEYCLVIKYLHPASNIQEEIEVWQKERQGYNSFMLEMNLKIKDKEYIKNIVQEDIRKKHSEKEAENLTRKDESNINKIRYFVDLEECY